MGGPPVYDAARSGAIDTLRKLLDQTPSSIEQTDEFGCTPLMVAVAAHRVEAVKELTRRGARLDAEDKFGLTPMGMAQMIIASSDPEWRKGQESFMREQKLPEEKIQEQLAKIDAAHSPAIMKDMASIVAILEQAQKAQRSADEASPLLVAVADGKVELLRKALENQWFVDVRNAKGQTPLMLAVIAGREDMAHLLLEKGASPTAEDATEKSCQDYAESGSESMRVLLDDYYRRHSKERSRLRQFLKWG